MRREAIRGAKPRTVISIGGPARTRREVTYKQISDRHAKILSIIIPIIFLIAGVGLLFFYFYGFKDKGNYVNSNTVYGEVVDYDFESNAIDYCDYYYNRSYYYDYEAEYARERCTAAIVVEYYVNDHAYIVKSGTRTTDPKAIGSKVKVKYNEDNPSESVILNDNVSSKILIISVGSIFTLVGVIGIASLLIKKDRRD